MSHITGSSSSDHAGIVTAQSEENHDLGISSSSTGERATFDSQGEGVASTETSTTTESSENNASMEKAASPSISVPSFPSHAPAAEAPPRTEIVHLHIVKLIHHNPTPGAPPYEVLDVVEGPAVPFVETVRAYHNQVLPAGLSPAEREQAVRQLKIAAWNNFVESMTPPAPPTVSSKPPANQHTAPSSEASLDTTGAAGPEAPLSRNSSDLQFPSSASPPVAATTAPAPQPHQQTPFQQLYTDHFKQQKQQHLMQQQQQLQLQQQQQAQVLQQQLQMLAPPGDVDVNFAYWQQTLEAGGGGDHATALSIIRDSEKGGQSKTKPMKDGARSQKVKNGGLKDKVKRDKGPLEAASAGKTVSAAGPAASSSSSAIKKRKNPEGDDVNPKKASAANKAQKLSKSMLSAGSQGVDMSALVPPEEEVLQDQEPPTLQLQVGAGMAKISGAGTIVPSESPWFPFPQNLDRAVNLFENRVLAWDQEKSGRKSPTISDFRQMIAVLNAEIAAKKKLEKKGVSSAAALVCPDAGLLLPSAADMVGGVKGKARDKTRDAEGKDVQEEWVQCDSCARWRTLPPPGDALYPHDLPDKWTCAMNTWHPQKASCSVPEDTSSQQSGALRAKKIRIWVRRLRSGDKYEARHGQQGKTGGASEARDKCKRFGEVDWIRCSSPYCGKWRACLRSSNAQKIRNENKLWFCWMNSWDEARSSCTAPQEGTAVHSLGEPYVPGDRAAEEDDAASQDDGQDDSSSERGDSAAVVQGISSRGRVVRSRWNSRRARK